MGGAVLRSVNAMSPLRAPTHPSDLDRPTRAVPRWLRLVIPLVLAAVWFGVFAAGGSSFSTISSVAVNDLAQHLPASAEATKVHELQTEFRDSELVPAVSYDIGRVMWWPSKLARRRQPRQDEKAESDEGISLVGRSTERSIPPR